MDAANVVSFALCLELMVVYEIFCPFWHSEVLASFVQFDDPACAYAETVNYNITTLLTKNRKYRPSALSLVFGIS